MRIDILYPQLIISYLLRALLRIYPIIEKSKDLKLVLPFFNNGKFAFNNDLQVYDF